MKTTPHALQPSAPEGLPQENSVKGGGGGGDMERARSQPSKWIHCSHVFWSLFFHNSGLQSEFYKVCSRMAVLRRGCTFIFIRAILIPKQLNGGTDLLVHRHQKNHFHVKVLIFSLVSKVTEMKHSTKPLLHWSRWQLSPINYKLLF